MTGVHGPRAGVSDSSGSPGFALSGPRAVHHWAFRRWRGFDLKSAHVFALDCFTGDGEIFE